MNHRYFAGLAVATIVAVSTIHADPAAADSIDESAKPPDSRAATRVPMNNQRLAELLSRLDENMQGRPGFWQASIEGREVTVITDEAADRMRIISGVARADALDRDLLYRVMQANFDTALDARYSIAQGILWSVYLHPLGSLSDEQFLSGVGQVINLAMTFGTTYSSGGLTFGGGDSNQLIEDLLQKGLSI